MCFTLPLLYISSFSNLSLIIVHEMPQKTSHFLENSFHMIQTVLTSMLLEEIYRDHIN
jgi:hypothetical protein